MAACFVNHFGFTILVMLKIDRLIRSRRKTISLIVQANGNLIVRAPLHTPEATIQQWVETKEHWVKSHQKKALTAASKVKPKQFLDGEIFLFLGQAYPLKIVPQMRETLAFDSQFKLAARGCGQAANIFEKWYKIQAMKVISERAAWFAERHGFAYKQVKITSARTRWGSCSSSGTLSFTWRLIMAPLSIIDYVIIHELAHTVQRNHAAAFWNVVQGIIPDYKQKRAWLKTNGHTLTLE